MSTSIPSGAFSQAKKDIQRLQRAIVDGLEDVKGQDIVVFDTEEQSALFERVIVASGTSNRQTRALASSVMDSVREAGFAKPRLEGEENGEWIIIDCGAAVVHVMQPAIRQYYRLEDLWGEKPVRLRHGSDKVAAKTPAKVPVKVAKEVASTTKKAAAKTTLAKSFAAKTPAVKKLATKPAAKPVAKTASKTSKNASAKTAAKTVTKPAAKSTIKKPVVKKST